jgi:hypothetical protein
LIIDKAKVDFQEDSLIEVIYEIKNRKMTEYFTKYQLPPELITDLNTSSSLSPVSGITYRTENLLDRDFATAWVEGQGTGEVIEIELDNFVVGYIGIINGYSKTSQSYYENSRIKSLTLTLFLDPDYPYPSTGRDPEIIEIELEDIDISGINQLNLYGYTQSLFSHGIGYPLDKIRIEVNQVYPGTKYQDLAVSELVILGFPEEKE